MSPLFTLIMVIVLASTASSIARSMFAYRARRLPGVDRDALQRLEAGLSELRDDIGAVRADVSELYERVDFAERMLAQQRDGMWDAARLGKPGDESQRGLST